MDEEPSFEAYFAAWFAWYFAWMAIVLLAVVAAALIAMFTGFFFLAIAYALTSILVITNVALLVVAARSLLQRHRGLTRWEPQSLRKLARWLQPIADWWI